MAPIRYSLHYEDYSEHLISRFGKLLQMQSLVDMTLMCNSHTLRVHKVVLAASSAYFQEVLQKQNGEPLIILKMRFNVLKCLVEFMYCGKTQCLEENLDELVAAAQFLKIKGLSKVTKEGLGITSHGELPVFTPPVVIDRPPQSLVDLHSKECTEPRQAAPLAGSGAALDDHNRPNKDMVMRIPFDITCGTGGGAGGSGLGLDYSNVKPRRGRPTTKQHGVWEFGVGGGGPAGSAGRALPRRDQESRKALRRLRHLQTPHLQDYMDSMSLSQAINSICGPAEISGGTPFTEVSGDFMYMERPTVAAANDAAANCEVTQGARAAFGDPVPGVNNVMSQYVNALKSAGLPTDLPILFEAGDGTYINVNEQVLLDMVQSGEIQYEVIEQPNIIDKVVDPNEIKSIDDLSKSIERGEVLLDTKNYTSTSDFEKGRSQTYTKVMEGMDCLDAILSDNLESFDAQQNYPVLETRLQDTTLQNVNAPDFSCIDGDIQFFTKTMNDDVKKYYEDQQLDEAKAMEDLCSANSTLDANYSMSLLDTKTTHLMTDNMESHYNAYNTEDLRQSEEYDFGLPLPQNNAFKGDPLDSLVSSAKENLDNDERNLSPKSQESSNTNNCNSTNNIGDGMLNDLIDFEHKIDTITSNNLSTEIKETVDGEEFPVPDLIGNENDFEQGTAKRNNEISSSNDITAGATANIDDLPPSSSEGNWDLTNDKNKDLVNEEMDKNEKKLFNELSPNTDPNIINLTLSRNVKTECLDETHDENVPNTENSVDPDLEMNINTTMQNNIPFAVGLLPLKQMQSADEADGCLKRKIDETSLIESDSELLKRKVKCTKL